MEAKQSRKLRFKINMKSQPCVALAIALWVLAIATSSVAQEDNKSMWSDLIDNSVKGKPLSEFTAPVKTESAPALTTRQIDTPSLRYPMPHLPTDSKQTKSTLETDRYQAPAVAPQGPRGFGVSDGSERVASRDTRSSTRPHKISQSFDSRTLELPENSDFVPVSPTTLNQQRPSNLIPPARIRTNSNSTGDGSLRSDRNRQSDPVGDFRESKKDPNSNSPFRSATYQQKHDYKPVLAGQPKIGDHFGDPIFDASPEASLTDFQGGDFRPDAFSAQAGNAPPYVDTQGEINIYEGKSLNRNRRPLLELGRPWYQLGQVPPSSNIFGRANLASPQLIVFGDYRQAIAYNEVNNTDIAQWAQRLNLFADLTITSTERFVASVQPLDSGNRFTRVEFEDGQAEYFSEFDFEFDTGFFEGDLGAIVGGMTNTVLPFDLPFSVGQIPLLIQNGIWMNDAFLGVAATVPARNSKLFDISNFDITMFYGFDNITTNAFQGDNNAAKMYGMAGFFEMMAGYIELDYAYLEDRSFADRSYHNIGLAYTRRYGRLNNSVRVIANAGQDAKGIEETAEGALFLLENSWTTAHPYTVVPYFNFFAGIGRPQAAALAPGLSVLTNTGINFESDGLTGYPTLDTSAQDTWGGAFGINLMDPELTHQLVLEFAFLQTIGEDATRPVQGNQYAVGARYQRPISNWVILRADTMYAFQDDAEDLFGVRMEMRHKF